MSTAAVAAPGAFRLRATHLLWVAFVLVQALDGVLTYVGLLTFGAWVEANPLVAWYTDTFGPGMGLLGAKLFAVACGTILYATARYAAVAVLTVVYVVFAIVPWAHLLS
jgi:hypothetical protein